MTLLTFYDSEYTSWEGSVERSWSGENEHRELVQLAAIQLGDQDSNSWHGLRAFNVLTRPRKNPQLSDYFVNLTSINQAAIDSEGISIDYAIKSFIDFCSESVLISWGNDLLILQENIDLLDLDVNISGLQNNDMRDILRKLSYNVKDIESGNSHNLIKPGEGIVVPNQPHNALSDCFSMCLLFQKLLDSNDKSQILDNLL